MGMESNNLCCTATLTLENTEAEGSHHAFCKLQAGAAGYLESCPPYILTLGNLRLTRVALL